jgi:hypothetical protein
VPEKGALAARRDGEDKDTMAETKERLQDLQPPAEPERKTPGEESVPGKEPEYKYGVPAGTVKRRWHFGDRPDGRRLRTIPVMNQFMPYIMKRRSDALNYFSDSFDITETDRFCRKKVKEGMTNFTFLHVFIAAYVRSVSQRPGINRFVAGQKIYAAKNLDVVMTIKRKMSLDSPDTCIKVRFDPSDTVDQVYAKFNEVVQANAVEGETNSFDKLNRALLYIPGLLLRFTVSFLHFLDYFGLLPRALTKLSPFHGSMIITSMGSLGIQPIYHHIYDFGTLPIFLCYGCKHTEMKVQPDGEVEKRRYVDIKVVTDERICDGFYYASAFKLVRRYVEHPELLEQPPEIVLEDVE